MKKTSKTKVIVEKDQGLNWNDLIPLVKAALQSNVAVLLLGHPGVGKSSLAKKLAGDMNLELIDIRLAQKDPAELGGVYFPDKDSGNVLKLLPPEWVRRACDKPCFIFLDEINCGTSKLHQAVSYQITLEKQVGPFKFHPETVVMAAGNLLDDNAIVTPLSSALGNRFAHFKLKVDYKSWVDWGLSTGIDWRILGYISYAGNDGLYLNSGDECFPSPRTWEMTSRIITNNPEINIRRIASSCVGVAAAEGLSSWIDLYGKVDAEAIILQGKLIDFTSGKKTIADPSFKYAAVFSVGSWLCNNFEKLQEKHLQNAVHFAGSEGLDPEFRFLFLRRINQCPELMERLKSIKLFQQLASEIVSIRAELYK